MAWWPEEPLPNLESVTETATQSSTMDPGLTTLPTTTTTLTTTSTFTTPSPETIRNLFSSFDENFFQNLFNRSTRDMNDFEETENMTTELPTTTVANTSNDLSASILQRNSV